MKIIVSIPLLALVVFLNSIYEGNCEAEQPAPVVVKVPNQGFMVVPLMNGLIYGGVYHNQVKEIPAWIRHPKANEESCQIYVEMPDGTGYAGTMKHLSTVPAVKGIKQVHAALKVTNGYAIFPLQFIDPDKIPTKVVHTRVYVVTPEGKLMYGIVTSKNVKTIKLPSRL